MTRKVAMSIWTHWLLLTAAYAGTLFRSGNMTNWHYIVNPPIGLFVPIYIGNFAKSLQSGLAILTFPLLLFGLYFGGRLAAAIAPRILPRLAIHLLVLALLSTAIDLILWPHPISLLRAAEVFDHRGELLSCCMHWI